MKLSKLLESITPQQVRGISLSSDHESISVPCTLPIHLNPDPEISSLHFNSREVQPGGLFVAIPGLKLDGHEYIDSAISQGAMAVISQKQLVKTVWNIEVENSRKALAILSSQFYGNPSEKLKIIGITGTNGKTTTAFLIEEILVQAGLSVGVIGTLNCRYGGKVFDLSMTTPESLDLHRILADMLAGGVSHVVMEVSSHAIFLNRIDACWMDVAVFTNLTQDHLDFHGNMEDYWQCKKKLFTEHLAKGPKKNKAIAVINCNDPQGKRLFKELPSALSVGFDDRCHLWPEIIRKDQTGMEGVISTPAGMFKFETPLIGLYNIENILCAAGACLALGLPLNTIRSGIESVEFVPGRLQSIPNSVDRFVYVDFAHTPDALENVLQTLQTLTTDRIICVFGCGGDRDREKRPIMGQIAASLANICIITSDNPRFEDPMTIIEDILAGVLKQGLPPYNLSDDIKTSSARGYVVEPDRSQAIEMAIRISQHWDMILIAGKGHETYQIIGNQTVPFDDRLIARNALELLEKPRLQEYH
ncbi:MAG: UDP-N-acetylmuramoyl-L-alanyl-D-glutamate--2,6-diaminopimelate ligase [Deltaproteobacteria bacterium]|nr:UDP-N-acetylmuramoyl-L-alanyl-D-glutamate--2,6-diaminopimelate ligase [Deltaproteobacteria bacterium]